MSMFQPDHDEIDREINEAARELTSGEPDRHFRSRVVARLSKAPVTIGAREWMWITAASVAAIAFIVALTVGRPATIAAPPPSSTFVRPNGNVDVVLSAAGEPQREIATIPSRVVIPSDVVVEATAESALPSIEIAPLQLDPLPPFNPIVIQQLTIPELEVLALNVSDLSAQ